MKISIVVPVLNENNLVSNRLAELATSLQSFEKSSWEVIVSDAGSTDGSTALIGDACRRHGFFPIYGDIPNPSIGKTVVQGLERSAGDLVLILPIDAALSAKA